MNRRRDDRERILDGTASTEDPVAHLLDAARGPATPVELGGLAAATATFAGAQGATSGDVAARASRRRPVLVGALAAAGLGTKMVLTAVTVGAIGVAAVELNAAGKDGPVPAGSSSASTSAPASDDGSSPSDGSGTAVHRAHPTRPGRPTPTDRPTATSVRTHPAHPARSSHPSHPSRPTKKPHPSHPAHPGPKPHPTKKPHPGHPGKPGKPGKPTPPAEAKAGSANRIR